MVFGHRNFWLLFGILKLIYFPTITNEETTYVAGGGGGVGVQRNRVFSRLSQISPRPKSRLDYMYTSEHAFDSICKSNILPQIFSDHSPVLLSYKDISREL